MDLFTKVLTEALPPGAVVILGIIIIRRDLNVLSKDVRDIKKKCDERLKWCIGQFKSKSE